MKKILSTLIVVALVAAAVLLFACADDTIGPHVHVYTYRTVAPTCVAEGYTEHVCLDCGDYYRDNFTVVTDLKKDESHVLGDWYTSSEPDCKNKEKFRRDCVYCDYQTAEVTVYEKLGPDGKPVLDEKNNPIKIEGTTKHTYHEEYRILVPATCSSSGYYIYICLYCGTTATTASGSVKDVNGNSLGKPTDSASLGHDYPIVREIAASCDKNGTETYGIIEYGPCTRCGDSSKKIEYVEPHESASKTVIAPTCTEAGYTLHTCKICGVEYKRDYKDATHTWSAWGNPYTKIDGFRYQQRYCTVCDAIEEKICSEQ